MNDDPLEIDYAAILADALPEWSIATTPPPGLWTDASPTGELPAAQGWKLHISATIWSGPEVLTQALTVLADEAVSFKVTSTGAHLGRLNNGLHGGSQIGKFMTVYPRSDADAVRIADRLAQATHGLAGPDIPSDRRIGDTPVHYRYGSFETQTVQNPLGQPILGIRGPDGEGEIDHRGLTFRPPDWVNDPFEAAGLVEPFIAPERDHVVDRRFLRVVPLALAARGSVHRGVDLDRGRRAVIKTARPNASLGLDGRDAAARLLAEAETLRTLDPATSAPELFGSGEWQGQNYLAMEEILGNSAQWHVQVARFEGQVIEAERARRWALDIGRALQAVHESGLVYRDIKLANVMIEDESDRARLVDFELATPIGGSSGQGEAGSRGYAAPRQPDRTLTTADDIFGFGALIWAFATTCEPSLQPLDYDLDRLDARLLNADADHTLLAVSSWCRQFDPGDRPETIAQAIAAIESPELHGPPANSPIESVSTRMGRSRSDDGNQRDAAVDVDWGALAVRAGEGLVREALGERDMAWWPSRRRYSSGIAVRTVYEGAAGAVLALSALVDAGHDGFRDPLQAACRWLIDGDDGVEHMIGLYTGEMGVATALFVAGRVMVDDAVTAAASEIISAMDLSRPILERVGPDYVAGAAGLARGLLVAHRLGGVSFALERADELATWICDSSRSDGDGRYWILPADIPRIGAMASYGYGHGAAGIADVLVEVAAATGQDDFVRVANQALDWVQAAAVSRPHGTDWPELHGGDAMGGWWCYGAGGIGVAMANAGRDDIALSAATHAGEMTWALPNRCHGLSGNIEVLLALSEALDEPILRSTAIRLGRLLAGWEVAPGRWPGESPEVLTPDYMVGSAGVIPAFLRLARHETIDPTLLGPANADR